jgi:hypothetical protein
MSIRLSFVFCIRSLYIERFASHSKDDFYVTISIGNPLGLVTFINLPSFSSKARYYNQSIPVLKYRKNMERKGSLYSLLRANQKRIMTSCVNPAY